MNWYESIGVSLELRAFFYRCRFCHAVFAAMAVKQTPSGVEYEPPDDHCVACGRIS